MAAESLLPGPDRADAHGLALNGSIKRRNRRRLVGSLAAVPLVVAVALLSAEPAASHGARRTAEALLLAAGLGLRLLALGAIDGCKKSRLVTWGPYRHIRHPLYCGSLLALAAFAVRVGSWSAGGVGLALFLALYLPAIRTEERFLALRFGAAWEAHRARTWALVPRPHLGRGDGPPFRIRRPWRDLGELAAIGAAIAAMAEWIAGLPERALLPDLFY